MGKAINILPFLDNFVDRKLPRRKNDNEELVTIPSTNISDDDVIFEISVALPGLDKKEVRNEMVDDYLTIGAGIEQTKEEKNRHWVRQEFVYKSFYRAFGLPHNADPEKVDAKMGNGLLTLKIGKKESRRKQKTINVG